MSKALSSTMEELSRERLSHFLSSIFGTLPLSGLAPDLLGFGAALVTSVLLACGLKQAGVLRTAMNVFCVIGFVFFLSVGGTHTRAVNSKLEEHNSGPRQILAGAGICCCLFFQFLELGRRSKNQPRTNLNLPLAISFTHIAVLLASFALGVVLSFMMDNRVPISGAPLLRSLQLRDVDWARLVMGSLQIIIIGLGISEAGESVCRHLVSMALDGFIPPFLSLECPMAFSHSRAHLLGGAGASIMALFLSHVYLLEFMASNILLLDILIVVISLYRPFRCSYDSLWSTSAHHTPQTNARRRPTPSSRLKSPKTPAKHLHPERTLNFLKNGIRVLTFNKNDSNIADKDDELVLPLLASPQNSNDQCLNTLTDDDISNKADLNSSIVQLQFKDDSQYSLETATPGTSSEKETDQTILNYKDEFGVIRANEDVTDTELISLNGLPSSSEESDEGDIQEIEDFGPEDIDTIVSEYKEQLRISTVGAKLKPIPTKETARRALICVFALTLLCFGLSIFSLRYASSEIKSRPELTSALKTTFIMAMLLTMFAVLFYLTRLPTVRPSSSAGGGFHLPGYTWVSFISLFMNIFLATELLSRTFWSILPLITAAILWYILYSRRHSAVAKCQNYPGLKSSEEGRKSEMVCLSAMMPTSVYTSRPQREELSRNI